MLVAVLMATAGCRGSAPEPTAIHILPSATPKALPTQTARPTHTATPLPTATATRTPTPTATPPTPTPIPPTATPLPATHTVCASGCDFDTIQAAVDATGRTGDAIIEVTDGIHAEAGITVREGMTVTIRGLGTAATVVQAHETLETSPERVFLIKEGALVTLARMTIRHGRPEEDSCGGGILSEGTLSLEHVMVRDNRANGGGGVCSRGGKASLSVINSTIDENTAGATVGGSLACGNGGGIRTGSGKLSLINTTVTGNTTATGRGRGGGIHIGCGGTAAFTNTTISGNRASPQADNAVSRRQQGHGGGVNLHGTLRLVHCTISGNHASGPGGGLFVRGHLDLVNTIVADNSGQGGDCVLSGPDAYGISGSLERTSYSLVSDGTCDPAISGDPMLGPLAENGGNTLTQALLQDSPAIDAVPAVSCTLPADQRGALRPVVRTSAETPCDIGAYEVQAGP